MRSAPLRETAKDAACAQRTVKDSRFGRYILRPGSKFRLDEWDPDAKSGFDHKKGEGLVELQGLSKRLEALQELLYAQHRHSLLIVLQGMDASGKDGTIRRVFEGVNPQGVRVAKFGPPTPEELDHDFLWRVHQKAPGKGEIAIFNRSHYEGVLVERVHGLVPKSVWEARYAQIRDFERLLAEEGATILKFYLNIDADEQKRRLQDRLRDRTKNWKFSVRDLPERGFWAEYMSAYKDALERTSTEASPWFIVPSNHAWFRDLVVCTEIVGTLEGLRMRYPRLPKGEGPVAIS
ncbi:MAG TPA: PPK2 family polyphosphate kinase [Nitrososphaerales archaeon]|nr:PPK2 family polyphosphate kinase [Nitrososphaerales archaeon]